MLDQTSTASGSATGQQQPRRESSIEQVTLTQSADEALQSLTTLYNAADAALSQRMRENPYGTLAVAAGVGFVLGGGMRSPMGQMLLRLSVKTFAPPLVNLAVHKVLERASALAQEPTS
jgi:ElaB/YqjD/DUF883 family membrane-anchored ribosome-binding protein